MNFMTEDLLSDPYHALLKNLQDHGQSLWNLWNTSKRKRLKTLVDQGNLRFSKRPRLW
jgi:hypothetical protein